MMIGNEKMRDIISVVALELVFMISSIHRIQVERISFKQPLSLFFFVSDDLFNFILLCLLCLHDSIQPVCEVLIHVFNFALEPEGDICGSLQRML